MRVNGDVEALMSDFSDYIKNKFGFTLDQPLDYRDLLLYAIREIPGGGLET
jgi:hypothetical protein